MVTDALDLKEEGLVYSSDTQPGIRRVRRGKGFTYRGPGGELLKERAALDRIRSLAIPPAWTDVWISSSPRGHMQATGRDAKGRKQFRYHPRWTALRDADKYSRLIGFSQALPRIRRRVARDLRRPQLSQEKVIATVVKLLETTMVRVGNEEYARQNGSYGLTTLRDRHARVRGSTVRLIFKGKTGKEVEAEVTDRRVARVVRQCQELPGQELFAYVDGDGARHTVSSHDVNDYLRETTGEDFTAKDFRTWAGTVLAATALRELEGFESEAEAKRNVVAAIDRVAKRLGNTRAVCRRAYVHPAVVDSYLDGSLDGQLAGPAVESAVLSLLRRSFH
ncbi:MAG: DNA topoisomerase IB, partial [Chloroflexi bacterium]